MRVLFLYPYLPSPDAPHGSARVVHQVLSDLRNEAEITLVCAYRPGERHLVDSVRPLCHDLRVVERRFVSDMGTVRRVSESTTTGIKLLSTGYPVPVVKLRTPALKREIDAVLHEQHFDLLHVELSVMAQYADQWARGPSVLVDHEAGGPKGEETDRWRDYVQTVYRQFTAVMTLCEEDGDELKRIERSLQIVVRPPGIDMPAVVRRRPVRDRVLFIGSSSHQPNRDAVEWIATELLPAIHRHRPSARVVVAGFASGGDVESHAEAAGVELLGVVPDLGAEIDRAAVVLTPVRSGRGVRIKNIEALARGAPLITTPLGARGLSELPSGSFVTADGARLLASSVAELLADPARAEAMGQRAGVATRLCYSNARQSATTLALWRNLLE